MIRLTLTKTPNFKKLLAVSKVSEHESIEDIIMQNEWLEFEENLREQNLDKVLRTCIKTCQVREDKEDLVRRETYIELLAKRRLDEYNEKNIISKWL